MKLATIILAAAPALALSACGTSAALSAQRSAETSSPARSAAPAPVITKTVIKQVAVRAAPATASPASQPPVTIPNVTNPWAVVSAYYGDVESGDYPEAWTLLSSGMVTAQTYQQFVAGYACTGAETLTEISAYGNQVTFSLSAANDCAGTVQNFTGTDTVSDGRIVAADVIQTGLPAHPHHMAQPHLIQLIADSARSTHHSPAWQFVPGIAAAQP